MTRAIDSRAKAFRGVLFLLAVACSLVAVVAAQARNPTAAQKAAIAAALRREQGNVAIGAVVLSSADPGYASLSWGFANGGLSARNNSLLALTGGQWKVLWTREVEQPADGACMVVPAPVAHDLLNVSCPPPAKLHARTATPAQQALIHKGFVASKMTPYARTSTGLAHICVSALDPSWAAAAATFSSGGSVYIWFKHGTTWTPAFESLIQTGSPPPASIVLSLASCVGYNPADFGG